MNQDLNKQMEDKLIELSKQYGEFAEEFQQKEEVLKAADGDKGKLARLTMLSWFNSQLAAIHVLFQNMEELLKDD